MGVFGITTHYLIAYNSLDYGAFLIVDVIYSYFIDTFPQKAVYV